MKNRQVNLSSIITAMISRGLTQTQMAERLNITQGAFSRILSGSLSIKDDVLNALSDVLKYPTQFFYEDIRVLPRYSVYYRRRSSMNTTELNKLHYTLYIQKHALKKLLELVEVPQINIPYVNPEKHGTPEQIADLLRQRWKIPRGPVSNLSNLVENAGIFILLVDVSDNFDGLVLPDEDGLPVIVLNKNMPADKQRFTLAHELGHLLMHTGEFVPEKDEDYEKEAHRFAAELLMPKQDIMSDLLDKSSFQRLASLKPYWKVSIAALVRRSYDLNVINKSRYTSLNVQLSRDGYKKNEPDYGMKKEVPTMFKQILDLYLNDLEYTERQLADKMCLSEEDFKGIFDIYSDKQTRFKIVRD